MKTALIMKLEEIERETQEQDEAWQRTKEALTRLGPVQLAVPRDVLAHIVGPTAPERAPSSR
jgi:hypothetical protein